MTWFLSDLGRLASERKAIEALESDADWLAGTRWQLDPSGLSLDAVLRTGGCDWPLRLVYPDLFPAAPITVRPQEAGVRWSSHQYGDGTLCLEWGPDNWHPEVTGRQMLESAYRLLSTENAGGPAEHAVAPSRHHLTAGQALRGEWWRVYFGRGLHEELTRTTTPAWVDFTLLFQSRSILVVIQTVRGEGAEQWENPDVPPTLRKDSESVLVRHAAVRRVPIALAEADLPDNIASLDDLLQQHGQPPVGMSLYPGDDEPASVLLLDVAGTPHFLYRYENEGRLTRVATIQPGTGADGQRLPPEFETLGGKAVGIAGLGSVGSKLAISLARAGVGRFVLVDEDIFFPENVVRNGLDLHNTGEHKADAVAAAIHRVAPAARVQVERIHLTGQESNAVVNGVLRKLGRCDLLIDATADPRVFALLAAVATEGSKPLVWMEVFGGGIGGFIGRHRAGKDPLPTTMRRAFHQYTAEHPAPEFKTAGGYEVEDNGRVLTATDADVTVLAGHAGQLALDTLLEREPSAYPYSMYLVGFTRAWVFEAPFHTVPIDTSRLTDTAPPEADEQTVVAGLDFLRALLQQAKTCA